MQGQTATHRRPRGGTNPGQQQVTGQGQQPNQLPPRDQLVQLYRSRHQTQLQRADNFFKEGLAIGVAAVIVKLFGINDIALLLGASSLIFMAISRLYLYYLNHIKPMH